MNKQPTISKTRYLVGLQCPKLLWVHYNDKDRLPPTDAALQAVFDTGHEIGELAQSLFPGGTLIEWNENPDVMITATREAMALRKPVYEAAFRHQNAYCIADILNPVGDEGWEVYEVKSGTKVKDVNLHDMAIQRYVYEGNGLNMNRHFLMHVNNKYARNGEIDAQSLLAAKDITEASAPQLTAVAGNLADMQETIAKPECPEVSIGPHCSDPYDCALKGQCWAFLPEHNVMTLYYGGKKGFGLLEEGIQKIADIPADTDLSDKQAIQAKAIASGVPHVDKAAISSFLGELEYPLYYLDFETFNSAIPKFDGVRPYQNVPIQFSLHIVSGPGEKAEHHSFLAEGRNDPRPELLRQLSDLLGNAGSVVAYNQSFEINTLKGCAQAYPEYRDWFEEIQKRFVDLLRPFRDFSWYHPSQKGSASLKGVLPALTGKSYAEMEIADGGTASLEFVRVTYGDVAEEDKQKVRNQLLDYCKLDTEGMIWIVDELYKFVK